MTLFSLSLSVNVVYVCMNVVYEWYVDVPVFVYVKYVDKCAYVCVNVVCTWRVDV